MDHRTLLSSMPPGVKSRLTERSDAKGLWHLAAHAGLLALCTAGIAFRIPGWPLLILPQGILLVFLFTLSHECTHRTPFRSRWLNEAAGHVCAVLIALPFVWFRYFHLAHHKYTNDPERDPELQGHARPDSRAAMIRYLSGADYWTGMFRTLVNNARGRIDAAYLPQSRHAAMRREARFLLAVYACAALSLFWSPLLFWIWLLPLVAGQPFLRLYLLAEHGLCPPVANMLENSRTTFTNRLVRAIAWNMPYHAEHHIFPDVPFHSLPDFHTWTADHLKTTSDGYASFTADYARKLAR